MTPKPNKKFVRAYTIMMLMQHAALTRLIQLHREKEKDEAFDKQNTIAYVMNAAIRKVGEEEARAMRGDKRRNAIVLSPTTEDFEIVLYPQIKVSNRNIPPNAIAYSTWSSICSKWDDILSCEIFSPTKEDEEHSKLLSILSTFYGRVSMSKIGFVGIENIETLRDTKYNVSLPSALASEEDKMSIAKMSSALITSMSAEEVDAYCHTARSAVESFYETNSGRDAEIEQSIGKITEALRKAIGDTIDADVVASDGVIGVKIGAENLDVGKLEGLDETIRRIIEENGGSLVGSGKFLVEGSADYKDEDEDERLPEVTRNLQRKLREAFERRSGGNSANKS